VTLDAAEIEAMFEVPPKPEMGDYAFPCFTLAKTMKKAPAKIASEVADSIELPSLVKEAKAAGGYLNFFVDRTEFTKRTLTRAIEEGENYGSSQKGNGKTVVIDFSSPNIAKPFGIGHLRSTVIGGSLYRIFETLGYRVVGVNHLGDWGTQIGKMMAAFKHWEEPQEFKKDPIAHSYKLYIRFHEEAEKDPQLEEEARDYFRRLEEGEKEAQEFWQKFMDISMAEFRRVYEKLSVHFDHFTGESFYNDMTEKTIELLRDKGLVEESEGALVVDLGDEIPPCMLRKADGATLYATRDLAAAIYRHETFDFNMCLYVVGYPQELHFRQVFSVLKLAGFEWARHMHHVPFGHILGMSTRKGSIVLLDEVLNEAVGRAREIIAEKNSDLEDAEEVAQAVGIGAVIFSDLKNSRIKDVNFDWNAILSFDGETGPYLQYTYVRFAGILRHFKEKLPSPASVDFSLLTEPEEWQLVRDVEAWPSAVEEAAEHFEPSEISTHMLRLASDFNRFYQKHRVIGDDAELTAARISLVLALKNVLAEGLSVLGLKALERM
jgi:arginyl-tRNA synthetase